MNKEDLITQINKIYQALNTISVRGYGDVKTLGNCLDAMQELAKDINSYEIDVQNAINKHLENAMKYAYNDKNVAYENNDIASVGSPKQELDHIQEEVSDIGEN